MSYNIKKRRSSQEKTQKEKKKKKKIVIGTLMDDKENNFFCGYHGQRDNNREMLKSAGLCRLLQNNGEGCWPLA